MAQFAHWTDMVLSWNKRMEQIQVNLVACVMAKVKITTLDPQKARIRIFVMK